MKNKHMYTPYLFVFGCPGSLLLQGGFSSSCNKRSLLSSHNAQASHCDGFSRCRARALEVRASVVGVHGLSCRGSWARALVQ